MAEEVYKLGNISVKEFEEVVRVFGFHSPVATAVWNTMHDNPNNQEEFEEVFHRWSAGRYTSDQNEKKYKLHARVTREIEVTEEQMERLCNHLCGYVENSGIDDILYTFTDGIDSGDYEYGYIPTAWLQADIEKLPVDDEVKKYFDNHQCISDDIEL